MHDLSFPGYEHFPLAVFFCMGRPLRVEEVGGELRTMWRSEHDHV